MFLVGRVLYVNRLVYMSFFYASSPLFPRIFVAVNIRLTMSQGNHIHYSNSNSDNNATAVIEKMIAIIILIVILL